MGVKWETLKKRVADEVYSGIKYQRHSYDAQAAAMMDAIAERRTVQESAADLADRCHKLIMSWDVRAVPRLRDLFPTSFPKSLRTGRLGAYMEDSRNSHWIVYHMGNMG